MYLNIHTHIYVLKELDAMAITLWGLISVPRKCLV